VVGTSGADGNLGIRSEPLIPTRVGGDAPRVVSARNRNRKSGLPVKASSEVQKIRIEAEISSEQAAVKARHQLKSKWVACSTLVACALLAGSAAASEGDLVLLPDLTGKLPILIVLFALLVYPVNAILFKPIIRVLDAREEKTTGTRKRAGRIRGDAEETLAKYESAVREARAEAEQVRKSEAAAAREENATVVGAARTEAERQLERARTELEEALAQSRQTLRGSAQSLADEAASRVLGRAL
jgi:F-type H+-transporting ATPase subunit b